MSDKASTPNGAAPAPGAYFPRAPLTDLIITYPGVDDHRKGASPSQHQHHYQPKEHGDVGRPNTSQSRSPSGNAHRGTITDGIVNDRDAPSTPTQHSGTARARPITAWYYKLLIIRALTTSCLDLYNRLTDQMLIVVNLQKSSLTCRNRKIKCDRNYPCNHCVKSDRECRYESNQTISVSSASKPTGVTKTSYTSNQPNHLAGSAKDDLQKRISKLEEMLAASVDKLQSAGDLDVLPKAPSTLQIHEGRTKYLGPMAWISAVQNEVCFRKSYLGLAWLMASDWCHTDRGRERLQYKELSYLTFNNTMDVMVVPNPDQVGHRTRSECIKFSPSEAALRCSL